MITLKRDFYVTANSKTHQIHFTRRIAYEAGFDHGARWVTIHMDVDKVYFEFSKETDGIEIKVNKVSHCRSISVGLALKGSSFKLRTKTVKADVTELNGNKAITTKLNDLFEMEQKP